MTRKDRIDWAELLLALVSFGGLAALLFAMVASCGGCAPLPRVFELSGDQPVYEICTVSTAPAQAGAAGAAAAGRDRAGASIGGALAESGGTGCMTEISVSSETTAAGAVDFASLQWVYGGFNGAGALPVDGCEIAALKVSASGMAYKWAKGGCEMLGASSRSDAACLACLFVRDAKGAWRGGKFDWISTSRTTRGFENIADGYNGWPKNAVGTAAGFAFVIVSRNGRLRTNVILARGAPAVSADPKGDPQ